MSKILELNGVTFEILNPRKYKPNYFNFEQVRLYDGYNLYTIYKNPSQIKLSIWEDWVRWKMNTPECKTMGVFGGNCNRFSIIGTCIIKGKCYIMKITKMHNYLIEVC